MSNFLKNNFYFFIKVYFILNLQKKKMFKKKKFLLSYSNNLFLKQQPTPQINTFCFSFFNKNKNLKKIIHIISNLFFLNKNVLFIDNDINYNYLPITNSLLFNRSFKKLAKIIKYFNISLIFYIDLKKKKFIFKKLYNCNVINVNVSKNFFSKKFDLNLDFINNRIHIYLLYLLIIDLYLKIKNN